MNVIYRDASKHFDLKSGLQFEPCLVGELFVGLARNITDEQAKVFEGRPQFDLLDDAALAELLATAEPSQPNTGDPITDAADVSTLSYPELLKLAKARGLSFNKPQPSKADLLAALAADPLGDAPVPPGSAE